MTELQLKDLVLGTAMFKRFISVVIVLAVLHSYSVIIAARATVREVILCPMHNSDIPDSDCISCDSCQLFPASAVSVRTVAPAIVEFVERLKINFLAYPVIEIAALAPADPEIDIYIPPPKF